MSQKGRAWASKWDGGGGEGDLEHGILIMVQGEMAGAGTRLTWGFWNSGLCPSLLFPYGTSVLSQGGSGQGR